jgi:hypothetical protein
VAVRAARFCAWRRPTEHAVFLLAGPAHRTARKFLAALGTIRTHHLSVGTHPELKRMVIAAHILLPSLD